MFINVDEILVALNISQFVYCLTVTIIYCDNQEIQVIIKNSANHSRMKHVNIQHHFVREKITEDRIQLEHVFISEQIADDLIKSLPRDVFERFRKALDLA